MALGQAAPGIGIPFVAPAARQLQLLFPTRVGKPFQSLDIHLKPRLFADISGQFILSRKGKIPVNCTNRIGSLSIEFSRKGSMLETI